MERRSPSDRRHLAAVPEALQRTGQERRAEERRASPRFEHRLWVADPVEGGVHKVFEGELGLGGASWSTRFPPLSGEVEVRFRVPHSYEEVTAKARVIGMHFAGDETTVRVQFTDLALKGELALARYLEARALPASVAA